MVAKLYQLGGAFMNRSIFLLVGLLLLLGSSYALSVVANPSPITASVSKQNPQVQFTASITLDTNDDAVAVYVQSTNGNIGISGPTYVTSSGTYQYTLLFPTTPGSYTGNVVFKATGSSNAQYQVAFSVTVTAWEQKYKDYFEKGTTYKVTVGSSDTYQMEIKDISNNSIILDFDGTQYTLNQGASQVLNDHLKVEVGDIFTSGAVLAFYTDGPDVNVTTYSPTTTTSTSSTTSGTLSPQDVSGFHFLIAKYSKYIQQGVTYTIPVTLVNDTDYRVYLKDIYFENTTVTPEGEKPTRLENYQMPAYLDPGQELTLKVTVDTNGLDVGKTYTPSLIALGSIGKQDVQAETDFYITVVKGVETGNKTTTTTNNKTNENNTPKPANTLRPMIIELVPPSPKAGDTVTIYAKDAKTGDYINATIYVNGKQGSTFTADWCKTYTITAKAEGYVVGTKTVTIPCKQMNVTYSPQNPQEGDQVQFMVTDAETGQTIPSAVIRIDGQPVGTTWTAKAGTHTVIITADGYQQKSIVINVKKVPAQVLSQIPSSLEVGQEINISLSKPANWEIDDNAGVAILTGTGDKISFEPKNPGTFTLKVDGKQAATIVVKQKPGLGISFGGDYIWWLAALGVVLVIIDALQKRKPVKSAEEAVPVGFDVRPKPRLAVPMGEEGQQGGSQ